MSLEDHHDHQGFLDLVGDAGVGGGGGGEIGGGELEEGAGKPTEKGTGEAEHMLAGEAPEDYEDVGEEEGEASPKRGRRKRDGSFRKAPGAPKRFKSSYICFFMAKQPEIKEELGESATVSKVSKRSAELWKSLSAEERAYWDQVAKQDKERYDHEKATYTGPWQVPWKRARKDPSAPKRPMSAFLYFSQGKRSIIKKENPDMKNTEVSSILGEMWRNLTPEQRKPFTDKEQSEREKYKVAMAEWRKENEAKQAAQQQQMMQMPQPDFAGGASYLPHDQQHQFAGVPPQQPPPTYGYPAYPYQPYPGYPPSVGYPTMQVGGMQPVILGPNGTPRYPQAPPPPFVQQSGAQAPSAASLASPSKESRNQYEEMPSFMQAPGEADEDDDHEEEGDDEPEAPE